MAFEQGSQTGAGRSLGVSSGEFRAVQRDTQGFAAVTAAGEPTTPTAAIPNLHYVFDDPNDGEPGRDRMLVHGVWELVLAAAVVLASMALISARPGALSGDSRHDILLDCTQIGLLAVASALGLRAGVPNLAVGGIAVFAGIYVSENGSGSWGTATLTAIGIGIGIGVVQGLVVVGLHVPSWAASLGALLALSAWSASRPPGVSQLGYAPGGDAYLWFGGFVALSVVGSIFGVAPGVRRGFARFRPVADPARRRTRAAALIALGATVGSTVVAVMAGVLGALRAPSTPAITTTTGGLESVALLSALGLGAALLGGTSAFGRRGGVLGTVLAACLLALSLAWIQAKHPSWSMEAVVAVTIGVGLAVTRLVERFGRPVLRPATDDDDPFGLKPRGAPWRPGPTPAGGLWSSDDGWGTSG
jgi:ribose/xylose/arabinose/galactoside ABC-type transport system permease subunit